MIVNREKKYIFIAIAKTACTSIHRRFGLFNDPLPHIYHMHLKDILRYYPEGKDYYKFSFVRNPYDRLVSAYYNFRFSPEHHQWAYPIYKFDTFRDFVNNLEDSVCMNFIHLRSQFEFLEVEGKIDLNFIGKFENLQNDFKIVEEHLGYSNVKLPKTRTSKHPHYTSLYDHDMKKIVQKIYVQDFLNFGYEK